jgi:2-polyprenyl-3-methyl-5-hydroxy-6-metoxy-1,4-benzoquinol methylase
MKEISDGSFDFIICSHVLEHVPSPEEALKEIFRVMRTDAKAIIMVPLFWDVKATIEDPAHTTDALRLKYYGQDDHVRLFARHDFLHRLKNAGFHVDELRPSEFEEKEVRENAISDNSILYVCTKR